MNTVQKTFTYLYQLKNRGIKLNLDRVYRFQQLLNFPDRSYHSFHIAGTNGKGSVVHYLGAILRKTKLKTGIYTSPHLIRFNERVKVNNETIPDEYIDEFITRWQPQIDKLELTYFEATTLLAMNYFRDMEVDVAVFETGLGGRLDATNIITPLVSVITSIGLDHTEQLGNTLAEIAFEKAGIMKINVPCVLGPMSPDALKIIHEHAREKSVPVIKSDLLFRPKGIYVSTRGTQFNFDYNNMNWEVHLSMIGKQAAQNTSIALAAFNTQEEYSLSFQEQLKAVESVRILGRLQVISESPLVYYDVAHNFDGFEQLLNNLYAMYGNEKINFLLGVARTKDISGFHQLFTNYKTIGIMTVPEPEMYSIHEWKNNLPEHTVSDFGQGSTAVRKFVKGMRKSEIGIIAGSHYIAEAVSEGSNFSLDRKE